jgi:hypothetical protein
MDGWFEKELEADWLDVIDLIMFFVIGTGFSTARQDGCKLLPGRF